MLLTLLLGVSGFLAQAQDAGISQTKEALAALSARFTEGYAGTVKGTLIDYHSLRQEVTRALLVRATDGTMTAEWLTAPLPDRIPGNGNGLLWLAGLDLNHGVHHFYLYVNDRLLFTFTGGGPARWEVNGPDGSRLSYVTLMRDQHGDGFGYMWMTLPEKYLTPGKPLRLRVTGAAENSTAWYMTFTAPDALRWFRNEQRYEYWMNVWFEKGPDTTQVVLKAPRSWSGKKIVLKTDDNTAGGVMLKKETDGTVGRFSLPSSDLAKDRAMDLLLEGRSVLHMPGFGYTGTSSQLGENMLIKQTAAWMSPGTWFLGVQAFYQPALFSRLKTLSASAASQGTIFLMNSSHQDIAWMDSPEKCIIERDTMLLTPLIDHALQDSLYRFDIEDVLMVREYLARHPDRKADLARLLREGRISVGASYNMPYEDMYSGESLLRQFYLGKRWLEKQFPGYHALSYWNVDVPGRTLQMPQIMKKAGVEHLVISRQKQGVYRWYAPDSSFVTTFSPGHYTLAYPALNQDFFKAASFLAGYAMHWINVRGRNDHPAIPLLSDWDMSPAHDYRPLIRQWESLDSYVAEDGTLRPLVLPPVKQVLMDDFFSDLQPGTGMQPLLGERPDVWLYIHGPSHEKALRASREGDILLPATEKFSTIAALLSGSFSKYPEAQLNRAWEAKIYPDHGWGGKHGDITDHLFLEKFEQARTLARQLLNTALQDISQQIKTKRSQGRPVVVFNDLAWPRTGPVSVQVGFDKGAARSVRMEDAEGRSVPCQLSEKVFYDDGSLREALLNFVAGEVPSVGYRTFYLHPEKERPAAGDTARSIAGPVENAFYRITFGRGGVRQIYDKELQVNLLDTGEYFAGEVVLLESVGNGAGEFGDIQQPGKIFLDRTGRHPVRWTLEEQGPVYLQYGYRQQIRHATVLQEVRIYKDIKRIDFRTSLLNWDGTLYREYRELFPVAGEDAPVTYEVPYGRVRVGRDEIRGAAGERYTPPCTEMHPRSILNWISASGPRAGVTLSSSVVAWDYKDPLRPEDGQTVLQPILLASRKSCHGEGNEYLQTGDHAFRFSFTSHRPGWKNGWRQGVQANHPLTAVVDPVPVKGARLPETLSFFGVSGDPLNVTAIKRQEEGEGVIIRWVEPEGETGHSVLHSFFPLRSVSQTNLLERDPVRMPFAKHEITVTTKGFEIITIQLETGEK